MLFAAFLFVVPEDADAQNCPALAQEGHWENVRQETNVLSRIEIVRDCEAGEEGPVRIRAFEKCHPRDCSWGWVTAGVDDRGRLIAKFATFTADRYLIVEPMNLRMRVDLALDFRDDEKKDTFSSFVLVKRAR
ncbi:MAG: hypothetical protein AAGE89_18510 [Pseudomonadota bacterium]